MSSTALPRTDRVTLGRLWRAGLVAAVVASLATVAVFVVTSALGISYVIPMGGPGSPPQPLTVLVVILNTVVPTIGATVLFGLLGRFTRRPVLIFQIIAVAFLLLSMVTPFTLPVELATQLGLNLMHLVAGVIITITLTRWAREA
jgi:hypothetical protein